MVNFNLGQAAIIMMKKATHAWNGKTGQESDKNSSEQGHYLMLYAKSVIQSRSC